MADLNSATVTIPPADPDATLAHGAMASVPLAFGRVVGDFELLDEIARGGMGIVFRARQVSLDRVVALKMILAGQLARAEDVQRFKVEAEAAAGLSHSNILPVYAVGAALEQPYFAMKLIDGGNLADELRKQYPDEHTPPQQTVTRRHSLFPLPAAHQPIRPLVTILSKVSRAVHFAHQHGILHRDLKPANILLDREGTPYVTDFGLAKRVEGDSGLTQTGAVLGTPSYMAPEQARADRSLTTAADVYSLGAMLYEVLTGRPPFRAPTVMETIMQVLDKEPEPPSKIAPQADKDLSVVALKCLEKEPSRRYASAAELAAELERWLRGDSILARPAGPVTRAVRWARRRPMVAGLAMALVCAMVGGTAGMAVLYSRAEEQRQLAEDNQVAAEEQRDAARQFADRAAASEVNAVRYWYAADMALAARAWQDNNIAQVRLLLDGHQPRPGSPDPRGFEWHYLNRLCHAYDTDQRLPVSTNNARLIADGTFAVTASPTAPHLQSWNLQSGKSVPIPGRFVIGSGPAPGGGWQVLTGEFAERPGDATGRPRPLTPVDGRVTIRTLDPRTGRSLAAERVESYQTIPHGQDADVADTMSARCFVADPTGRSVAILASTFENRAAEPANMRRPPSRSLVETAVRWVDTGGTTLVETTSSGSLEPSRPGSALKSAAVSADRRRLAFLVRETQRSGPLAGVFAASDAGIRPLLIIVDRDDGQKRSRVVRPDGFMTGLTLTPNGRRLITVDLNHAIHVLDAESGKELAVLEGHAGPINALAFSADGKELISASDDTTLRIWDLQTHRLVAVVSGHESDVVDVKIQSQGTITSIDRGGAVKTWSRAKIPGVRVIPKRMDSTGQLPSHLRFLPDGQTLLVDVPEAGLRQSGADSKQLFDAATGQLRTLAGMPPGAVMATEPPGPGSHFLLAGRGPNRPWTVWNSATNTSKEVRLRGISSSSIITPDGSALVSATPARMVNIHLSLFADGSGRTIGRLRDGEALHAFLFTGDGRQLIAVTHRGRLHRWDTSTWAELPALELGFDPVGEPTLTPDSLSIVVGCSDGGPRVVVVDLDDGKVKLTIAGLAAPPRQIVIGPNGQRAFVLFGGGGKMSHVKCFSLQGGQELLNLSVAGKVIDQIALNHQGTRLAGKCRDAILVWDATPLGP